MTTPFDKTAAANLLNTVFASWVHDLDLSIETVEAERAVLRMKFSEKLCRDNGVVCGQALMSLADTSMVIAVSAAAGGYLPMTTVDQTIHFLRPAVRADLLAEARVVRIGRTMAYGSITIATDGDSRPVAMAQTAYALLRDAK
ncbi:PaaI family thioesterase [Bradyrhizobium prioriisuperbiae]|uniref:PaaI family thioesterase n=1 Tax=Bradyrhizobium prioriisuperbiae TaxID=2854389 RepID=UPI0028EDDDDE|nr:PaaI family thioesterase [Bradyrhizobium prioritasuperba]